MLNINFIILTLQIWHYHLIILITLINLFILALYNKSISDPFTSVKAFDAKLLKSLKLFRKGFDLDFEILVKLQKKKCFFLEVPVNFKPRTPKQGKKITALDGLKCLYYIIFSK